MAIHYMIETTALKVKQQAIAALAKWTDVNLLSQYQPPTDTDEIARAKKLLSWSDTATIKPLKVLFDKINLIQGTTKQHYWDLKEIENKTPTIPYPKPQPPTEKEIQEFKTKIKSALENINQSDWENISYLNLILEKYGSHVSMGDEDVAIVDLANATAAVATAIADNPSSDKLSLIAGDLSGIQNFIYTISSEGALKSLRARSFYLELVTTEVVQNILEKLNLPRNNVIYAGGGNLYILGNSKQENESLLAELRKEINQWLLKQFQGKIFLALDMIEFNIEEIASNKFATRWTEATKKLGKYKGQKFKEQIEQILEIKETYEPCQVCHRDDVAKLKPLNQEEDTSVLACDRCRQMYELGAELFDAKVIVRAHTKKTGALHSITFPKANYYLFERWQQIDNIEKDDIVYLINDWTVKHYRTPNTIPLLLGNYAKESQETRGFISASEMASCAIGVNRVGYLRMDVDRLGQIFAKGLGEKQTLTRLAGLSRQMSYFFKVYLNTLAETKQEQESPNILFIYAGGDDLFVSGSWNEVVDFGFDIYQSFRAYTGNHPDITLSAGISLAGGKFPLYQSAEESGKAEEKAKDNGRDSLGLFGQVFKWDEWLGKSVSLETIYPEIKTYLKQESIPEYFGILPIVKYFRNNVDINYSRSFIRNLLATAELQEKMIKNTTIKREKEEIRYFLHLPVLAYTIARLPDRVRENSSFKPVGSSLKNPYNAPYFRAIATWLEFLNREQKKEQNSKKLTRKTS